MSDGFKQFSELVLHELRRQDTKLDKITDKQSEQNEHLLRNTITLEEHIKRTKLLEDRAERIEDEVDVIKDHVDGIKRIFSLVKPTKEKLKWLAILAGLAGGGVGVNELARDGGKNEVIEKSVQKEQNTEVKIKNIIKKITK